MADAVSEYDHDYFAWALEQARLLREGHVSEADIAHIAEELESMGRGEKRELISRLAVLLTHLLKWQFQPSLRSRSWQLTIQEQRRKLDRHLGDNPTLASLLDQAVADAYGDALLAAQQQSGLGESAFAPVCPYAPALILDSAFLPG
jgi:hypothetical protein